MQRHVTWPDFWHGHSADSWDAECQFKVEQANFRKDQYLAEEVERSSKRRRETSERVDGNVHGQGDQGTS